jgi:hypothetical protein
MYTKAQDAKNNDMSRSAASSVAKKKNDVRQDFGFVDNRPEAKAQKSLQMIINNSPRQVGINLASPPLPFLQPRPPLQPPLRTIQLIKYKGYWRTDSWVTWGNKWKTGAEEKWKHLEKLYGQAVSALQGMNEKDKKRFKDQLQKIESKEIGYSEYKTKMARLVKINEGIDLARMKQADTLNTLLRKALDKYKNQKNKFTEDKNIEIPDEIIKALIIKIYTTNIGKTTCNEIQKLILLLNHKLTLKKGPVSASNFNSNQSSIKIKIDGDKYASGESGQIIVNNAEITLIHELGHCLHNLEEKKFGARKKSKYDTLDAREKLLWSNEEEYENITKVENKYRKELGLPLRKYHATDLIRKEGSLWVQKIRRNEETINYLNIINLINKKEPLFNVEKRKMIEQLWRYVQEDEDKQDAKKKAEIRSLIRTNEILLKRLAAIKTIILDKLDITKIKLAVKRSTIGTKYLLDLGYPNMPKFV